jgi:hypothetical protein
MVADECIIRFLRGPGCSVSQPAPPVWNLCPTDQKLGVVKAPFSVSGADRSHSQLAYSSKRDTKAGSVRAPPALPSLRKLTDAGWSTQRAQ